MFDLFEFLLDCLAWGAVDRADERRLSRWVWVAIGVAVLVLAALLTTVAVLAWT